MRFIETESGRPNYIPGTAGDCVTRAVAEATQLPYQTIRERLMYSRNGDPDGSNGQGIPYDPKRLHPNCIDVPWDHVSDVAFATSSGETFNLLLSLGWRETAVKGAPMLRDFVFPQDGRYVVRLARKDVGMYEITGKAEDKRHLCCVVVEDGVPTLFDTEDRSHKSIYAYYKKRTPNK
jgi:hypothetical protein